MSHTYRYVIGAISLCLLFLAASCNESVPTESPAVDSASAAEDITNADQLYGQREDLLQLRRAIVLLRQAQTKDPGNYDAAWKLSKFDYYLATHTPDSKERDDAFKAGIEAGKAAVQ